LCSERMPVISRCGLASSWPLLLSLFGSSHQLRRGQRLPHSPAQHPKLPLRPQGSAISRGVASVKASHSNCITHFQECDVRAPPSSAFWSRQQLEVASSRSQWPPLNSPPLQLLLPEQPSAHALWLPRLEAAACASSSQAAPTLLILRRGRGEAIDAATGSEIDWPPWTGQHRRYSSIVSVPIMLCIHQHHYRCEVLRPKYYAEA
jgi:hypothetical protein